MRRLVGWNFAQSAGLSAQQDLLVDGAVLGAEDDCDRVLAVPLSGHDFCGSRCGQPCDACALDEILEGSLFHVGGWCGAISHR
jgi:hypothetical protein